MGSRWRADDGANAVEFALVLPLLVILIFGAITAGLALNARQQLDHAGREGARFAATLPQGSAGTPPCDPPSAGTPRSWHECVRDHVLGTSVGSLNLSGGGQLCVAYVPDGGAAVRQVFPTGATGVADPGAAANHCIVENPALTGPRVQVKVIAPSQLNAVFVRASFDLTTRSVARYEED